jgi:hypothetical protein
MLSDIERQLLHYNSQCERTFRAARRSIQHQRALGYAREQSANMGPSSLEEGPAAA